MNKKKKVTFNVDEELYIEYKKVMLEKRTTPTADLNAHIKKVVEESKRG